MNLDAQVKELLGNLCLQLCQANAIIADLQAKLAKAEKPAPTPVKPPKS